MGIAYFYSRAQCTGIGPRLKVLGNLSREQEIDSEIELAQQAMGMPPWKKVKTTRIIVCILANSIAVKRHRNQGKCFKKKTFSWGLLPVPESYPFSIMMGNMVDWHGAGES